MPARLTAVVGLACMLSLAGCFPTQEEFVQYLKDPKAQRVAVQVCLPDRMAAFDPLIVDVTDLPADIHPGALGQMFNEARQSGTYNNPYKSDGRTREYETIAQWRAPSTAADF